MQKIVNVIALSSGLVSAAVIASGVYVYVNRDAIIDNVKSQAMEAVLGGSGGIGGALGGAALGGGDALPLGANDLAAPAQPQASTTAAPSAGLGTPTF